MVAAAVVAGAAVSAAGSMASGSAGKSASGKAGAQQAQASAEARRAIQQGVSQANAGLAPYAGSGVAANNELAWQMGLTPQYQTPTTISGNSGDPVWDKIVNDFQQEHQAKFGVPMTRDWNSDAGAQNQYAALAQKYQAEKAANPYQGSGEKGALMQNFSLDQYKNDPGYTPMVNSLEELQATPGYQFQLEQGLQGVNNSAAAKGSLLSGAQLKGINNYAQGVASTGYQAAWDRAQQAYNNAFSRDTTNKNNAFQKLQTVTNNGQQAATQQGNNIMSGANAQAGIATNNGNNQASLSLYNGQQNQAMIGGVTNAITSGLGAYGASAGGGGSMGSWFGGGGGQSASAAVTPNFQSGKY